MADEAQSNSTDTKLEQPQSSPIDQPNIIEALPKDDISRKRAEKTATAFSYQRLLLSRNLEQTFEVNKHLKVTFRSLSAGCVEFVFRMLSKTHAKEWTSIFDEALRVRYVAAAMQELGDNKIGADLDEALMKGEEAAEKVLLERVQYVQALPSNLVYLLYSHYMLFNQRVDKFIKGNDDELGNS